MISRCITLILVFLFSFANTAESKKVNHQWETFEVKEIYDFQTFQLLGGEVVRLANIKTPDYYNPEWDARCLSENLKTFLKAQLIEKKVKIKGFKKDYWHQKGIKNVELKFGPKQRQDLTELLIENGWAKLEEDKKNNENTDLISIQNQSKYFHRGWWGQCDTKRKLKHPHDKIPPLPPSTLGQIEQAWPAFSAKVLEVTPDHDLVLSNGITIRLLGLKLPDIREDKNEDRLNSCFRKSVQKHLHNILLYKTILVRKDAWYQREDQYLWRYVYIPSRDGASEMFLNAELLEQGFGLYDHSLYIEAEKDVLLSQAQAIGIESPKGAFKECLKQFPAPKTKKAKTETSTESKPEEKQEPVPENAYDENCPIKGNVSGTKKSPIKKYHTPLSGWYKRVKPEKCFDDEASAQAAGFVKVK